MGKGGADLVTPCFCSAGGSVCRVPILSLGFHTWTPEGGGGGAPDLEGSPVADRSFHSLSALANSFQYLTLLFS